MPSTASAMRTSKTLTRLDVQLGGVWRSAADGLWLDEVCQ